MIDLGTVIIAIAAWCGNVSNSSLLANAWRTHTNIQTCRDSLQKCLKIEENHFEDIHKNTFAKCFKAEVYK